MTLLINGCSFGECWNPTPHFIQNLNCNRVTNLSKGGTSFQRTVRSTIEWLSTNPKPNFVIIPITFTHRWEMCFDQNEKGIDGTWTPLQNSAYVNTKNIRDDISINQVKKFMDLYYGLNVTIRTFWDKVFTEIILMANFFENNKIKYLMFDMCNDFDKKHIKGYQGFKKLSFIERNNNIIDIWKFCGNKFMWQTLNDDDKLKIDPLTYHHRPNEYKNLENYLLDYINSCIKK